MSLLTRSVPITTAADGTDLTTIRLGPCVIRMIRLELGTLDTPDITITEEDGGKMLLGVAAVAADADYYPTVLGQDNAGADVLGAAVPVPVLDRIEVATVGGGDTFTGRLIFFYEH